MRACARPHLQPLITPVFAYANDELEGQREGRELEGWRLEVVTRRAQGRALIPGGHMQVSECERLPSSRARPVPRLTPTLHLSVAALQQGGETQRGRGL